MKTKHCAFALATCLGLSASATVHAEAGGFLDDLSYYAEGRYGTARISAVGISENVGAYSIGGGVQLNAIASLRGEYMTTAEDTDLGFGWSVATVGFQFERDAYRNGLGFYATADHNSISADSGFGGDTGSFFGFGLGTRYQLQSGIRLFAEGKLHSGDFGFLSGGARFRF